MQPIHINIDPDLGPLVEKYLNRRKEEVHLLLGFIEAGNWQRLREITHQLIGNAGSYGFNGLSEIAVKLYRAAINENAVEAKAVFRSIEEYLQAVELHS